MRAAGGGGFAAGEGGAEPTRDTHRALLRAGRQAVPCTWGPWDMLPSLGPLFGARGAPRLPAAVALAATWAGHLRDGPLGPAAQGAKLGPRPYR